MISLLTVYYAKSIDNKIDWIEELVIERKSFLAMEKLDEDSSTYTTYNLFTLQSPSNEGTLPVATEEGVTIVTQKDVSVYISRLLTHEEIEIKLGFVPHCNAFFICASSVTPGSWCYL